MPVALVLLSPGPSFDTGRVEQISYWEHFMKIFLVGGAVRDELLQRPVKDRDYVVVGSTPAEMLALGYEKVGADFPVFLHPETKEEYALARTERKTGVGYNGFETTFDPSITLEDDLRRRDLTINAMAKDLETGEIVDPFNGLHDLQDGILRHVSPAFAEDPLRVLRVARFRARYNFRIARETVELMQKLVTSGEVDHLTPERVWVELEKGLSEPRPNLFIMTLMAVDAWGRLFNTVRVGSAFHLLNEVREDTDLDFNSKLMLIFSATPVADMNAILEKYRASVETMRVLRVFKTLQTASEVGVSGQAMITLLKIVEGFRQPEVMKATVKPAMLVSTWFGSFVHSVIDSYEKIKDVSFASLTPEQQTTLKGKQIGDAIDLERLKVLMG